MAYELITKIIKFIGASTDTKPTSEVPAGSTFLETDTYDLYVLGGGTWNLKANIAQILDLLGAVNDAAVANPASSGSAIALLKGVLTDLGQTADAAVAAGAVGSMSAKLRRLTTDLDALLTQTGEVQASPTANTLLARLKDIKDGIPLTGRKLKVGVLKTNYTAQVNAGASATVQIIPTAGYIGRLITIGFYVAAVAGSTGNHSIAAQVGTFDASTTIYSVIQSSIAGTSALTVSPSIQVDYGVKLAPFSSEQPLNIVYTAPGTNPQTGIRYLMVLWEEEAII